MKKNCILEERIYLYDKKIARINKKYNRDEDEGTEFKVTCFDGFAVAEEDTEDTPIFNKVILSYPRKAELSQEDKESCLMYRYGGNEPTEDCHFGDIMMRFGKVVYVVENK